MIMLVHPPACSSTSAVWPVSNAKAISISKCHHVISSSSCTRMIYATRMRAPRQEEAEKRDSAAPSIGECMQTDHNWVGLIVHTRHAGKLHAGKVVGWFPPQGDETAFWHVTHSDGDEEDLDEREIIEVRLSEEYLHFDGCCERSRWAAGREKGILMEGEKSRGAMQ